MGPKMLRLTETGVEHTSVSLAVVLKPRVCDSLLPIKSGSTHR